MKVLNVILALLVSAGIALGVAEFGLRALGFAPITIETAAGRADYEAHQRAFTARAEPLRTRLLALCERLLA